MRPVLVGATFFAGAQPVLGGEGLRLRPWQRSDADVLVRAYSDPALRHWHMRSMEAAEAPAWIEEKRGRWAARAGVDWAITSDGDDAVLGRLAVHRLVLHEGLGEVAYWVLPEARGRRIAPRALGVLCAWAFGAQGMHRLELAHAVGNPASCRVAERAGFELEGVKRAELRHDDGWHDMHLHARLAGDPPPPSSPG